MTDDARTPRSYRPARGTACSVTRAVAASLLLPPGERARVAALWELVDAGAGFDEVLDALLAGGLSDLEGFVLWSVADDLTQVVVRGPARVVLTTAEGEDVLDGASAATWAERRVRGVRSTSVEIEDVDGPDLGVVSGLVRVGRVDEPAYAEAADEAGVIDVVAVPEAEEELAEEEPTEPADPVASEDVTGLEGTDEPVDREPVDRGAGDRAGRAAAARAATGADPARRGVSAPTPPTTPVPDPLSDPLPDTDDELTEQLAPAPGSPPARPCPASPASRRLPR